MRETETETDRESERGQRQRQTERVRETETETERVRETETETDRESERDRDTESRHTNKIKVINTKPRNYPNNNKTILTMFSMSHLYDRVFLYPTSTTPPLFISAIIRSGSGSPHSIYFSAYQLSRYNAGHTTVFYLQYLWGTFSQRFSCPYTAQNNCCTMSSCQTCSSPHVQNDDLVDCLSLSVS